CLLKNILNLRRFVVNLPPCSASHDRLPRLSVGAGFAASLVGRVVLAGHAGCPWLGGGLWLAPATIRAASGTPPRSRASNDGCCCPRASIAAGRREGIGSRMLLAVAPGVPSRLPVPRRWQRCGVQLGQGLRSRTFPWGVVPAWGCSGRFA